MLLTKLLFFLEDMVLFHKNMSFVLTYNGFTDLF